eukprot:COSAG01_NODE_18696_length_1059_cov_1.425000_1_plen_64_part_00
MLRVATARQVSIVMSPAALLVADEVGEAEGAIFSDATVPEFDTQYHATSATTTTPTTQTPAQG